MTAHHFGLQPDPTEAVWKRFFARRPVRIP